jgi:glycerol-3-phosphate acyltransferase PlsY
MQSLAFSLGCGFLMGALPFSVWLACLMLRTDIRAFGDGNPGAANARRAGTWRVGIPTLLLDFLKGAVRVSLAHYVFEVSGWGLVAVALAPVLGHAFSPFLRLGNTLILAWTHRLELQQAMPPGARFLQLKGRSR